MKVNKGEKGNWVKRVTGRQVTLITLITPITISLSFASPNAGASGAQFLNLGVSARSIAMGNAYSAVSYGGVVSANYNPAGLSGMVQPEVSFMHYRYILDSQFSYLGYAHPLGKKARAIFAGNLVYGAHGSIEETQVAVGQDTGVKTGTNFSASDSAGTFSFAYSATKKLGLGVNFKYVTQEIGGLRASGLAGDAGLTYRMGPKLSFGLAARNIGPDLKFERDSVPLPGSTILGIHYALLKNEMLVFAVDIEKPRNQNLAFRFGGEINLGPKNTASKIPQLSIRAGHDGTKGIGNGVSFGAGMRLGNYAVDYAFVPFGQLGEAHRISATVRFGKVRQK